MKAIKLKFDKAGVDFFSDLYFSPDHNSEGRNFLAHYHILSLWNAGLYHVFVPLSDDDQAMGICHGTLTHGDFFGHCYFLPGFRGRIGLCGLHECIKLGKKSFKLKRVIANILNMKQTRAAKLFVLSEGFRLEDDRYILDDLKEY